MSEKPMSMVEQVWAVQVIGTKQNDGVVAVRGQLEFYLATSHAEAVGKAFLDKKLHDGFDGYQTDVKAILVPNRQAMIDAALRGD